jgi:hypothetical protein
LKRCKQELKYRNPSDPNVGSFLGQFTNEFSEQISKCEPEVDSGTLKSGTTTGKGNKSDPDVGSLGGQFTNQFPQQNFKNVNLKKIPEL